MHPKDAEGIANSVYPDQTAPLGSLIWVCIVCPDLSVRKLGNITVTVFLYAQIKIHIIQKRLLVLKIILDKRIIQIYFLVRVWWHLKNETLFESDGGVWCRFFGYSFCLHNLLRFTYKPRHEKTCLGHMRTTKAQINLRIRAVWSASLLFAA